MYARVINLQNYTIHNLTNSINFKTSSLKLQDFCHFDDATLVAITEYAIGRRMMSSFQVCAMMYLVNRDVSGLSLHHFDFNLHTNYLFLGLCKYIHLNFCLWVHFNLMCLFLKKTLELKNVPWVYIPLQNQKSTYFYP